jgi:hypothetical protein
MNIKEQLQEHMDMYHNGDLLLIPTDMEEAVIGTMERDDVTVAVVSRQRVLKILAERQFNDMEDPWFEAMQWYDHNIEGAYMGPRNPIYVEEFEQEVT